MRRAALALLVALLALGCATRVALPSVPAESAEAERRERLRKERSTLKGERQGLAKGLDSARVRLQELERGLAERDAELKALAERRSGGEASS